MATTITKSLFKGNVTLVFDKGTGKFYDKFSIGLSKLNTILDSADEVRRIIGTLGTIPKFDAERKELQGRYNKKELTTAQYVAELEVIDVKEQDFIAEMNA
jgi:hypothetical protein